MIVTDALSCCPDLTVNAIASSPLLAQQEEIKKGYEKNPFFSEVILSLTHPKATINPKTEAKLHHFEIIDDLLYFEKRLCISSYPADL